MAVLGQGTTAGCVAPAQPVAAKAPQTREKLAAAALEHYAPANRATELQNLMRHTCLSLLCSVANLSAAAAGSAAAQVCA
jgi:hypothetical protein